MTEMAIVPQVVKILLGTSLSIEEALEALDYIKELSIEALKDIESKVFCCDGCGWWCNKFFDHVYHEGQHLCYDCYEELGN